jgi:hypothetical protein
MRVRMLLAPLTAVIGILQRFWQRGRGRYWLRRRDGIGNFSQSYES